MDKKNKQESRRFTFLVSPKLWAAIEQAAKAEEVTASQLVRKAVKEMIEEKREVSNG